MARKTLSAADIEKLVNESGDEFSEPEESESDLELSDEENAESEHEESGENSEGSRNEEDEDDLPTNNRAGARRGGACGAWRDITGPNEEPPKIPFKPEWVGLSARAAACSTERDVSGLFLTTNSYEKSLTRRTGTSKK